MLRSVVMAVCLAFFEGSSMRESLRCATSELSDARNDVSSFSMTTSFPSRDCIAEHARVHQAHDDSTLGLGTARP